MQIRKWEWVLPLGEGQPHSKLIPRSSSKHRGQSEYIEKNEKMILISGLACKMLEVAGLS